jgi:phage repressor protein C with HTH and peptisase S24 domain
LQGLTAYSRKVAFSLAPSIYRKYVALMICEVRQQASARNAVIFAAMTDLDLKRRLQIAGRTQEELAAALRISSHSASRLVLGKRKMSAAESDAIDTWLADADTKTPSVKGSGRIPLYGYAQGANSDRVAFTSDRALDWVDPPPFSSISGPMAVLRISGDSMEPRLFAGEEVVVALDLSPARGRDCVIEFADGTAAVKQYERSRDGFIFARQYNPDKEVRFPASEVKAVHAVIWRRG